jgi:hypothetical protein
MPGETVTRPSGIETQGTIKVGGQDAVSVISEFGRAGCPVVTFCWPGLFSEVDALGWILQNAHHGAVDFVLDWWTDEPTEARVFAAQECPSLIDESNDAPIITKQRKLSLQYQPENLVPIRYHIFGAILSRKRNHHTVLPAKWGSPWGLGY